MDNTKELVNISTCTGYGGLDEGLELAFDALRHPYRTAEEQKNWDSRGRRNIRHAAYVEIEAVAAYNLVAQMERHVLAPAPVWTDLKSFPWDRFYGKIHGITGGYPCQPFSQAGLQGGVDDPRHLFPYLERGIDAVRPVFCWFENVANHLNIGFEEVRQRLHGLGYKVEAGIFSAEDVGAPHLRKRLFILAVADTYCTEQSKRRGDLAEVLGIPQGKSQSGYRAAVSGGDSSGLGNSNDLGEQQRGGAQREIGGWAADAGETLDHASGYGHSAENQIRPGRDSAPGSGSAVDHAIIPGLEGQFWNGTPKRRWQEQVRSIAEASLFPAGQGRFQFPWEEARLESSLGFTVDGYDFTEDLLRMAGNAVVPQQAQSAFITLIHKFLK